MKTLKNHQQKQKHESIEEWKYPQEYENGGFIVLDDLNEKDERPQSTSNVETIKT